jgi:hypothetical protein
MAGGWSSNMERTRSAVLTPNLIVILEKRQFYCSAFIRVKFIFRMYDLNI